MALWWGVNTCCFPSRLPWVCLWEFCLACFSVEAMLLLPWLWVSPGQRVVRADVIHSVGPFLLDAASVVVLGSAGGPGAAAADACWG